MKIRHIALTFFIAIFAAFVFFTGWTQWRLAPGQAGIVMSKTSGICREALLPGVFSWHWEFLLPTNAVLVKFNTGRRTVTKEVSGSLPSSALYGEALGNMGVDFAYNIAAEFTADITAQSVLKMCENGTITDEASLADYIQRKAQTAAEKAASLLLSGVTDIRLQDVQEAAGLFCDMRITKCTLPDRALYQTVKEQYIQRLKEKEARTSAMKKAVASLISEFPELKDSVQVEGGFDAVHSSRSASTPQAATQPPYAPIKEETVEKRLVSIRGATGVEKDEKDVVVKCVNQMCSAIFKQNGLKTEDIVSIMFTITSDIHSINPATALRGGGLPKEGVDVSVVPLFCAQEPVVDGMAERVIRVMVTAYMAGKGQAVYINGAEKLRAGVQG